MGALSCGRGQAPTLSNLPGFPVFNPFSLFFGSRDTGMAIKNSRDLAWLYLLRDIRAAASAASSTG
jgi:hypothetical protein